MDMLNELLRAYKGIPKILYSTLKFFNWSDGFTTNFNATYHYPYHYHYIFNSLNKLFD